MLNESPWRIFLKITNDDGDNDDDDGVDHYDWNQIFDNVNQDEQKN